MTIYLTFFILCLCYSTNYSPHWQPQPRLRVSTTRHHQAAASAWATESLAPSDGPGPAGWPTQAALPVAGTAIASHGATGPGAAAPARTRHGSGGGDGLYHRIQSLSSSLARAES